MTFNYDYLSSLVIDLQGKTQESDDQTTFYYCDKVPCTSVCSSVTPTASRRCSVTAHKPRSLGDILTPYSKASVSECVWDRERERERERVIGIHELTPTSEKIWINMKEKKDKKKKVSEQARKLTYKYWENNIVTWQLYPQCGIWTGFRIKKRAGQTYTTTLWR